MSKIKLIEALKAKAIAKRAKALMELEMFIHNPAAIGEHTRDHLLDDASKSLADLADAESELDMIEFYLQEGGEKFLLNG